MKKIIYFTIVFSLLYSCVKDNSTSVYPDNNPNFSKIKIDSKVKSLSVDHGYELVYTPDVTQSIAGKELKYYWTANKYNPSSKDLGEQIICCEGPTFKYTFKEYGTYKLRLEVKNEDYSVFNVWDLSVRTYDKGYFIIGNDESGKADIAFGRELSETDSLEGKKFEFSTDIIRRINPTIDIKEIIYLSKSILAYGKNDAYLHIFTKEKIYVADPNTFEIFYTANFTAQYPGEYIEKVSILDSYSETANLYTSKKRIMSYKKKEFGLFQQTTYTGYLFDNAYMGLISTSGPNMVIDDMGVDEAKSKVWFYIPYHGVANNTMDASLNDDVVANVYAGYDIISVFRMNGDAITGTPNNFVTIAQKKGSPNDIKLIQFKGVRGTGITTESTETYTSSTAVTYEKGMKIIPNARYNCAYYAKGNKIYYWTPTNTSPQNRLPVNSVIDLDEGKEITTMSISYDMRKLYVGFYDKNSSKELKGGLLIYETKDIGINLSIKPLEVYENITTKPVQILYKSNVWDKYSSN